MCCEYPLRDHYNSFKITISENVSYNAYEKYLYESYKDVHNHSSIENDIKLPRVHSQREICLLGQVSKYSQV